MRQLRPGGFVTTARLFKESCAPSPSSSPHRGEDPPYKRAVPIYLALAPHSIHHGPSLLADPAQ